MNIHEQLHRIRQGDRAAFAPVVLHFQGPLFHYLGRMGLGAAVAQEIAQETFLRAWSHLAEFDPQRAQFSTWLFTLARHLALHALDKAAHQHEHSAGDDLPDVASPAPGPADALDAWLLLLGSVAAGGLQLGSFVLGIWTAAGAA